MFSFVSMFSSIQQHFLQNNGKHLNKWEHWIALLLKKFPMNSFNHVEYEKMHNRNAKHKNNNGNKKNNNKQVCAFQSFVWLRKAFFRVLTTLKPT